MVKQERDEAQRTLKTVEQGLEELGVKITGDMDKQIARTKQLTNELRSGRLEEELRETKKQRDGLLEQVAELRSQAVPSPLSEQKRLCLHLTDELEKAHERYENDEQKIASWAAGLSGRGLSDEDFGREVETKRDETS